MTCPWRVRPCPLSSFNYGLDVFNFGLLLNSWCSLLIPPCYANHYCHHTPLGTLKFSVQDFRKTQVFYPYVRTGRIHWLYTCLLSDYGRLIFIILCCLPKALQPILFSFWFIYHVMDIHLSYFVSKLIYSWTDSIALSSILISWHDMFMLNITLVSSYTAWNPLSGYLCVAAKSSALVY